MECAENLNLFIRCSAIQDVSNDSSGSHAIYLLTFERTTLKSLSLERKWLQDLVLEAHLNKSAALQHKNNLLFLH